MAKILKEANENPDLWKIEVTCTGKGWHQGNLTPCYRLIEVTALDIRRRYYDGYTYYGFVCPVCGCFTEICSINIPYYIKSKCKKFDKK